MSGSDPMNETEAMAWLKRQLGCGKVNVELSNDHVLDALYSSRRWWVSRKGVKRVVAANIYSGTTEYLMPPDTDEVIEVWFPSSQIDVIASVDPYAFADIDQLPIAYQALSGVPGSQFYGSYHQIIQHAETARRLLGSEHDWWYVKDENLLRISPTNQRSGSIVVRYASSTMEMMDPVAPATTPKNDFRNLAFRDRDVILRYAKAEAKEILGRIRGKYNEWPSAGGAKSMDGDVLLSESQQEKERLEDELIGLSEVVPFLTG